MKAHNEKITPSHSLPPRGGGSGWGGLFFLIISFFVISPAIASDGHLILYNYHLDEVIDVQYKTPKGYDKAALEKINHLMRSPDDKEFAIPPALIELIDDVQDHFGAEAVEIISGYRSPSYNGELKKGGRSVANESLHMQGIAADIHIDEVTEEAVKNYAESLKKGGVGYYPVYNFVHLDLGPVRSWGEPKKEKRILVGTDSNPNNAWRAVTDKNEYAKGEDIEVEVTNAAYETMKLTKNIWFEHFRKGRWAEHGVLEKRKKSHIVKAGKSVNYKLSLGILPYGKHRLVIFTSDNFNVPPVISNEFYIKKE